MRVRGLVDPWLPPLLLMGVIFALSAQPHLDSGLGVIDLIGRKIAHAATYALLCVLWWRALRTVVTPRAALAAAVAVAIAYAISDEYHQSHVEGRTGSVIDVAIDAVGAAAGLAWARRRRGRAPAAAEERAGAA